MAYRTLTARARKDPLGYSRINDIIDNQAENQALFLREHLSGGRHNLMRDFRGVAFVRFSAGSYSLAGNSSSLTAVASPATGEITLTVDSAYNESNTIVAVAQPAGSAAAGPISLNYKRVSATSFKIFQWRGAAWAAENNSFMLGFYAQPVKETPTLFSVPKLKRGVGVDATTYNSIITNDQTLYSGYAVGHTTTTGAHSHRETPKGAARINWTGAAYTVTTFLGTVSSASRVSAGVIDVTLPASTYLNNPNPSIAIFARAAAGVGEHWKETIEEASLTNTGNYLTTFRVHLWKKSSTNTWTLTDGSFRFIICSA